ncbi:MAG: hypothetical protein QNL04_13910 [SAR324 cluster bacterium]|nr:hypothetical protein [SAR324 cluster bacterium]
MQFSLVFNSKENSDLSYTLVYIPGTAWKRGNEDLVTMADERYQMGSVAKLLKSSPDIETAQAPQKECLVIAHPTGHGQLEDYNTLLEDLRNHGYSVIKASFKTPEIFENIENSRPFTLGEVQDMGHLGLLPPDVKKSHQERMDLIFNNGSMWTHRSLRTLFDCYSSEWNMTSMSEKVEILRTMLKAGEKLGAIRMQYELHYLDSGRSDIAKSFSASVTDILEYTLKNGQSL